MAKRRSTSTASAASTGAPRVVGYARVSTAEQASEGVSLEAQRRAIASYCRMRGLDLVELVTDAGVSAGKPLADREGGRAVLDRVTSGDVSGVVAFKLDRVFRDCADCLSVVRRWDTAGVALHLIDLGGQTIDTGTAMGRFFLTVMAGAAELERNLIGERTAAALAHIKADGATLGRCGIGYRRSDDTDNSGRRIVEHDPAEQATVARLRELAGSGLSLRAIASTLTSEGHQTKRGGRWAAQTVANVLRRFAKRTPA